MTRIEIINLLRLSIELAGDGGPAPFTHEEHVEMNNFLNQLENE
jgi:hypothetical protein